jgi:hypothetical protein
MTGKLSRPGLQRRMGAHKKPKPFDPVSVSIESIFSPWGELSYDGLRFAMTRPLRSKFKLVTYSDLVPVGSTVFISQEVERFAEAVHTAACPEGG